MGEVNSGQRALFFSILGIVNASLLWPLCLALYLTGSEMLPSQRMPWISLLVTSISLLSEFCYFMFVICGRHRLHAKNTFSLMSAS